MNIGDVVWLKSGSPPMTVAGENEKGLKVVWVSGGMLSATVPVESVMITDPIPLINDARARADAILRKARDDEAAAKVALEAPA